MLILMCGLPGSGKSTYLKNRIFFREGIILCPDDFRLVLTGRSFYEPAEDSIWSHVKIAARVLLKRNYHVIIDCTNLTVEKRKNWINIADEIGINVCCWWQNVPLSIVIERNKNRSKEKVVPFEAMERMINSFIPPMKEEGFLYIIERKINE